ncbi:hypothetical protein [Salinivibrio sharmensis]|uniref:Uncharacterized protein n=1 Tax=Salinivibrio sharmensis TaxID=390883 RepID=A0ABX3K9S3_9GAMM|nr:hypothetical protein [Salinivibrio sharmensis]OOE85644.1 hypothetical protein BZG74_13795 [Salinivibrio sharmensis]
MRKTDWSNQIKIGTVLQCLQVDFTFTASGSQKYTDRGCLQSRQWPEGAHFYAFSRFGFQFTPLGIKKASD